MYCTRSYEQIYKQERYVCPFCSSTEYWQARIKLKQTKQCKEPHFFGKNLMSGSFVKECRIKKIAKLYRGRILKRTCNKGIKSFHPRYSQSPLLTDVTLRPKMESEWFETVL
jgi:hypothetical protein